MNTQQKIQSEVALQMGQMMLDLISRNVERQELIEKIVELESDKPPLEE